MTDVILIETYYPTIILLYSINILFYLLDFIYKCIYNLYLLYMHIVGVKSDVKLLKMAFYLMIYIKKSVCILYSACSVICSDYFWEK